LLPPLKGTTDSQRQLCIRVIWCHDGLLREELLIYSGLWPPIGGKYQIFRTPKDVNLVIALPEFHEISALLP